jgi:heat shock protein HslJ
MKKILVFTILIMAMLLAACSGSTATPSAKPTDVPAAQPTLEPTTEPVVETSSADVDALTANPWAWVSFTDPMQQYEVENPQDYTLTFLADGTVNIKADCNNALGTYTLDGRSITIEVGPMTLAMCPPESRSDDFIKYLGFAAIYFFEGSDLYIDLMADGGTMKFSPAGTTTTASDPLSAMGVNINGEPYSGELYLGGGEEKWLNPTLISALGGTSEGAEVDASGLGEGCSFFIPTRPDVVINWEAQEGVEALKFFFLSLGDSSMAIVTPSGEVLCNDDLNPLVLDPFIEVKNPEAGRYLAFLGSFEDAADYPGFLAVTTLDFNPATMDLTQLFPRRVDPRGVPEILSLDVLNSDSVEAATPTGGKLSDSDLPFTQSFTAGGQIGAFNLDQPNQACTGFISAIPTFRFDWNDDTAQLVMFFESNVDTTLVVRAPDGTFHCNDDFKGSQNINPLVALTPAEGTYYIWVGSFAPDTQAEGMLTITNDATAAPAVLTSEDLP